MNPRIGHSARQDLRTQLRVDPRVVLRSQLLELSQPELQQLIETELSENPALERLDDDTEPMTDEAVLRVVAPQELKPRSEDFEYRRSLPPEDQLPDWVDLAASPPILGDHLRAQLFSALPKEQHSLAAYMVDCLNAKGYLVVSVEEIALQTGCSLEDVHAAHNALKACEPRGIGASSLQECLLLQLRGAHTLEQKLARKILRLHWEDFIARRISRLMRKYKVVPEVIEAAIEEILALTPFPAEGWEAGTHSGASPRSGLIVPDLSLLRAEHGWTIEVMGAEPAAFIVSRGYLKRLKQLQGKKRSDREELGHVSAFVQRAQNFIDSLAERRKTMRRIGEFLIQRQESFVTTGLYQFLKPLTRSAMARELGLHESTISRATMGKFVRMATSEVVPFEVFFKPALRVQKMIEEILATENPSRPMSDEEIAKRLAERGVHVARRTVNKYRDRTKLPSSRSRRSA